METMEIAKKICKAADDKKAGNIIIMDMRGLTFSTDYFVVCSAPTATQVRAIADNVEEELDKAISATKKAITKVNGFYLITAML